VIATRVGDLPEDAAISAVTLAELHLGVHRAATATQRAARVQRLAEIESAFEALPVDGRVARAFGVLAAAVGIGSGRRARDLLIAATAAAHGVPLYTRDAGFAELADRLEVRLV